MRRYCSLQEPCPMITACLPSCQGNNFSPGLRSLALSLSLSALLSHFPAYPVSVPIPIPVPVLLLLIRCPVCALG